MYKFINDIDEKCEMSIYNNFIQNIFIFKTNSEISHKKDDDDQWIIRWNKKDKCYYWYPNYRDYVKKIICIVNIN